MPRARTQFGSVSWAETASELATEMTVMPLIIMAGAAT